MSLLGKAKSIFNIRTLESSTMNHLIGRCGRAYEGRPDWTSENVKTINFAKSICSEVARLTMLGTRVEVDGVKKNYIQDMIDVYYPQFRKWMEYAAAYGTIILKPNGTDIDVCFPHDFGVTDFKDGKIWGAIFINKIKTNEKYYVRFEWHRFEEEKYIITNKCFVGDYENATEEPVSIENTPWNMLDEEVTIEGLKEPLFAVLTTPQANNIDKESVMGLPIFYEALEELKDLDIAYSRNATEIFDSKRTVLLDSDLLSLGGSLGDRTSAVGKLDYAREKMGLPDFAKAVSGNGDGNIYREINPTLNTSVRIEGMNNLLSEIGYKVGFANGYFVFNENSGIQTATGVEADQQRTVQFIKDCRDQMEHCLTSLINAISAFADLYNLAPAGDTEIILDFGDILYSRAEDKARWWTYVTAGKMAFWRYLVKFEGMTEEEAKEIESETAPAQTFDLE